jgi:hypothetical protein
MEKARDFVRSSIVDYIGDNFHDGYVEAVGFTQAYTIEILRKKSLEYLEELVDNEGGNFEYNIKHEVLE